MQPGLVIVSNRLPVSVKKVDGKLEFKRSINGMSTGINSYARRRKSWWVGWPGIASDNLTKKDQKQITEELAKRHCYPVFLTQAEIDGYYNGYSNSFIWPLFHDVGVAKRVLKQESAFWRAYQTVNQRFADVVAELATGTHQFWVHDYQLMLLPAMLRRAKPQANIGYFLHIPFPNAKKFATLKHARQLLDGLFGADLIGFQTQRYIRDFTGTLKTFGIVVERKQVVTGDGRVARIAHVPIGVDYERYLRLDTPAIQRELLKFKAKYRGKKLIISVDRLDPAKGILERAEAYQHFLKQNPDYRGKVVFLILVVPSRTEIKEYQQLKDRLEASIAKTNETYGTKRWEPIEYVYDGWEFDKLTALYHRADIAFVTPIRDGMNLVAKEYIASQQHSKGVLVLSQTAGAAEELKEAILVSPLQRGSLVNGLKKALLLPPSELKRSANKMQENLAQFTVTKWANSFMSTLQKPVRLPTRALSAALERTLVSQYKQTSRRAIFLDYDGTLAEIVLRPEDAVPTKPVLAVLKKLAQNKDNAVYVISGRSRHDLGAWVGGTDVGLVAEHGAFVRDPGKQRWQNTSVADTGWKAEVRPILEIYADLTPNAHVEEKSTALVWHYRESPPYAAQKNMVLIKKELKPILAQYGLKAHNGKKVIEIKHKDTQKGAFIKQYLAEHASDFVLTAGDDYTDETMFNAVPPHAYSIKVGAGATDARFRVKSVSSFVSLLEKLAK